MKKYFLLLLALVGFGVLAATGSVQVTALKVIDSHPVFETFGTKEILTVSAFGAIGFGIGALFYRLGGAIAGAAACVLFGAYHYGNSGCSYTVDAGLGKTITYTLNDHKGGKCKGAGNVVHLPLESLKSIKE